MRRAILRSAYFLTICVTPCYAFCLELADAAQIEFKDQFVVDVIEKYKSSGFAFVYSTSLLRPHLKFDANITLQKQPIERLKAALESVNLTLQPASTGDQWLIVKAQVARLVLTGSVSDAETGAPLAGVRVEIGEHTVYTDEAGIFTISSKQQPHPLSLSHPGYEVYETTATLEKDLINLLLTPSARIEEVTVVSSRYEIVKQDDLSRQLLTTRELTNAPSLGEDSLRAVNRLPGSASVGVSARPHIRGGLQDETLVLFNNVELLEPFHLKDFQSVFSTLNPNLIKAMDVYTGGFPARYGDRMSAVIDITPTDDIDSLGGELSLSMLTSALTGYGQFGDAKGQWQFSARRGNLDLLTKQINPNLGHPSYVDAFGHATWQVNGQTKVESGVLVYNDNIKLRDLETDGEEGIQATSKYRNTYGWLQIHKQLSENTNASSLLSYGTTQTNRDGFLNEEDADGGIGELTDRRRFILWSFAHNWSRTPDLNNKTEWGLRLNHQKGNYDYQSQLERGFLAEIIGIPVLRDVNLIARPRGNSGNSYVSVRRKPLSQITFELGLRWDFQDFSERGFEQQISPRLSLKYDFTPNTKVRASAGRFHQADGIHELQIADGHQRFQGVQHADHFILGVEHYFNNPDWQVRIEGFYKRIQNPKRRYENLFNPLVFLPETAPDRIRISPTRALAKGIEMSVRYNPSDNLDTAITYSRASARDYVNGDWQARTWDQTHSATASFNWIQDPWLLSLFISWHSGWLTTDTPASLPNLSVVNFQRNDSRLPHFFSIDAKIMRTWKWPRQTLTVFAELTNLTDRDNVGGREVNLEEDETTGGFTVISRNRTLLPIVPSIGFRWQF